MSDTDPAMVFSECLTPALFRRERETPERLFLQSPGPAGGFLRE